LEAQIPLIHAARMAKKSEEWSKGSKGGDQIKEER